MRNVEGALYYKGVWYKIDEVVALEGDAEGINYMAVHVSPDPDYNDAEGPV
jgi:hypothetical protein